MSALIQTRVSKWPSLHVCCWQLASGIYSFACSLWSHHTDSFLQQICARDEATALSSLERTLLSLKGNGRGPNARPSHARDLFKILTRKHESDPLSRAKCFSASRCDGGRKKKKQNPESPQVVTFWGRFNVFCEFTQFACSHYLAC